MANSSPDPPFPLDDSAFLGETKGESSRTFPVHAQPNENAQQYEDDDEVVKEGLHGLTDGMDPEGFSGPPKIVKPLTSAALAAFKAAQERAGVIYISRIPPGMRPAKVLHLMSAYGEVGRVYLQQEGALNRWFKYDNFFITLDRC